MASVGVRELRQQASAVLRRVIAGETIEVTDRGTPVALLTPFPSRGPLEALRASGDLASARASISDLPEPLHLLPGQELPSKILERLRRDER